MSIVDGFRLPDTPVAPEDRETLRVLMVVQSRADAELASRRLRQLEDSYRCSVTLLGVARLSLLVQCYAPLSGVTTPDRLAMVALQSAGGIAQAAAADAGIPAVDSVGAAAGWKSVCLVDPLRLGVYDALVIGSLPRGRLARRRLLAAARGSGTTVLVGAHR
jgi:hypothetical protein